MEENKLPLGLYKQAVMKLDSFITDIREIMEDDQLRPEYKLMFEQMSEMSGNMIAAIINVVSSEMNEDDFVSETIDMDEIQNYPEDMSDIMDKDI